MANIDNNILEAIITSFTFVPVITDFGVYL